MLTTYEVSSALLSSNRATTNGFQTKIGCDGGSVPTKVISMHYIPPAPRIQTHFRKSTKISDIWSLTIEEIARQVDIQPFFHQKRMSGQPEYPLANVTYVTDTCDVKQPMIAEVFFSYGDYVPHLGSAGLQLRIPIRSLRSMSSTRAPQILCHPVPHVPRPT